MFQLSNNMIKNFILLITFSISASCYAQQDSKFTTIDFVQILNDNKAEAVYYFQNNWKVLREMALEKGYIDSYQVLETSYSDDAPFHLMFVTTYSNKEQYDLREDHFGELIKEKGGLDLMNDKKPGEFRKSVFTKEAVRHWE